MKYFPLLILFALVSCINRQKFAESSINCKDIENDILVLSDDSLQGRAPFTIGETRTINYLEKRMREIGLEPAFNGEFTQGVPLVELTSIDPDHLDINTPHGKLTLNSGTEYTARGTILKENICINSSELVFVGFGIYAPEKGWNDFKGIDVKGKTIIVLVNDPDFYTGDTTLFKGKEMTYQGRWRYKFEEAERQGAKACFIVHEDAAAGYPWTVASLKHNSSDFVIDDENMTKSNCLVNGWLTKDAAIKLFASCNMDYEKMKDKASRLGFRPINMNAKYDLTIKNLWKKSVSRNIAGYVKGGKRPNEVIVYCAHWDHFGKNKPVNGDSIYNGTSDNAAAISWMLSIAKAFKNAGTPNRSILFLAPTAEEAGMLGSTYFVAHSPFSMQKTVACINTDVILFLGKFKDVTVTGLGHSELDRYLAEEAKKQDRYVCPDPNPENGMFFRSDQLPFLKAGVPAIFAKGYSEQVDLGKEKTQQKIDEYWKTTYHKPSDVFNPKTQSLEGLCDDAKLFFNVGWHLANENYFPKWYKKSEFYVAR